MKLKKFITIFSVLLGYCIFLFNWQTCFPDGCVYKIQNPVCQDGSCFNESLASHLQEKSQFLNAITETSRSSTLFFILLLSLFLAVFFNNKNESYNVSFFYQKFKCTKSYSPFNPLINLFSDGILNPKIF
jgi:hypothetical protein